MVCKNCNAELAEGSLFCGGCGAKVEAEAAEANAVAEEVKEEAVAEEAEAPVAEEAPKAEESKEEVPVTETANKAAVDGAYEAAAQAATAQSAPKAAAEPKAKSGKKKAIIGVIIGIVIAFLAVVLIVGIIIAVIAISSNKKSDALIYLKDSDMFTYNGKESVEVDSDVYEEWYHSAYDVRNATEVSPSGKYLFYPVMNNDGDYDLYRVRMNKKDAEAEKVDSDITDYYVMEDDFIIYIKDGNKLYYTNMEDKEKLSSEANFFRISDDEKYILYWSLNWEEGGDLCVRDTNFKNDEIEIDSDVTNLYYTSDDFSTIIYQSEDKLYVAKNFEEKEKIDAEASDVYVEETKDDILVYYMLTEETEVSEESGEVNGVTIYEFIDDDMKAADEAIVEPSTSDYKKTVDSWFGSYETTDWDAYNAAYYEYRDKLSRDNWRESWQSQPVYELTEGTLNCYSVSSKESTTIKEDFMTCGYAGLRVVDGVCLYNAVDIDNAETVKMSFVWEKMQEDYSFDAYSAVKVGVYSSVTTYMYKDGVECALDIDYEEYYGSEDADIYNMVFDDIIYADCDKEAQYLYFAGDLDFDDESDLYRISYANMTGELEVVYEDVDYLELIDGKDIYYLTDYDAESDMGELYCNGERVDSDVVSYSVFIGADDAIYYETDLNDDYEVTLKKLGKSESERIAEDVYDYRINEKGEIAIIMEYNYGRGEGELYIYSGKEELQLIDEDVSAIIYF